MMAYVQNYRGREWHRLFCCEPRIDAIGDGWATYGKVTTACGAVWAGRVRAIVTPPSSDVCIKCGTGEDLDQLVAERVLHWRSIDRRTFPEPVRALRRRKDYKNSIQASLGFLDQLGVFQAAHDWSPSGNLRDAWNVKSVALGIVPGTTFMLRQGPEGTAADFVKPGGTPDLSQSYSRTLDAICWAALRAASQGPIMGDM